MFVAQNLGRVSPARTSRHLQGLALGKAAAARAAADSRARMDVRERLRFVPIRGLGDLGKVIHSHSGHFRLRGLGDTTCSIDPTSGARVCNAPVTPITPVTPTPPPVTVSPAQDDPVYPGWKSQNPPGGSYKQSCTSIASDGSGNLWATCLNQAGKSVSTSLNYSACTSGAPYNVNGQLMCGGPGGSQVATPASGSAPGVVTTPTTTVNPLTGGPYPVGTPINPVTGQPYINPATGLAYPPGTIIDANTGYPVNPQTGLPYNPATGLPISASPASIISSPAYSVSPYVSTTPAGAPVSVSSSIPWSKILIFGGLGIGGLVILKMLGVIGKK